jgi:hypothetical protein
MMTCEHYWRDGILRVERGEPDPHHSTCADCRRAHDERDELVRALPRVGAASTGDPHWQTRVWSRIAREETARARRSYWLGAGLVAACAIAVVYAQFFHRDRIAGLASRASSPSSVKDRPRIEIVSGQLAMRSTSARVGDRVRISIELGQEVRVYRADLLVLRCRAQLAAPGCVPDAQGLVAETELATAGEYQLVVIPATTFEPVGTLDRDLAAVVSAGGDYKVTELSVR